MRLTDKQIELIRVIGRKNTDGSYADIDQILERLNYKTSKQSLQFSLRALSEHGLIERIPKVKRRNQSRTLIALTALGEHFAAVHTPTLKSSIVEVNGVEDIDLHI